MAETGEQPVATEPAAPARPKRSPVWVGLGFLLLICGVYGLTQYVMYSGPPIQWRYDYDQARAEAAQADREGKKKRIILLLHEPGCKVTARNEREVLSTRFARELAAQFIPCRVELKPNDPLREKFSFDDQPLLLCVEPSGLVIGRIEGRADETQLRTYFKPN